MAHGFELRQGLCAMIGRGFGFPWMKEARRVMASDGSGSGLPPLPIIDDTAAMMGNLEREHGRVARAGGTYCLILVRLDNVDGKEAAPEIVEGAGKRFSVGLRPKDSIYRFGPDMYLIGVSNTTPEHAPKIMDRLRMAVSDRLLTKNDGRPVPATASLGGTMLDSAVSIRENLDRAGRALFAAAQNGGDSFRLWSTDLELALSNGRPDRRLRQAGRTE